MLREIVIGRQIALRQLEEIAPVRRRMRVGGWRRRCRLVAIFAG
jgi:hypothetical protein